MSKSPPPGPARPGGSSMSVLSPIGGFSTASTHELSPVDPQSRKLSTLSVSSDHLASMSRKRSMRQILAEVEKKVEKKKTTTIESKQAPAPSIFEAAALIKNIHPQRIDLLSG
ncbi:unnamed protein product, partial [Mesorhabditis belari]|uniref:Uncharacterized protein n=1 Tax=Mesorhabditis belari TaxID=2138241 RepID=A0AAF3EEF2_9BILA